MDKLTMAHEWYLKQLEVHENASVHGAWQYAGAMQAEADKRNKAEAAQKHKEVREILNDASTFIEREGQHFDDVEEWQPDWSQAPEWANWWATDSIGYSAWYSYEPYHGDGRDYWSDYKNKYDNSEKSGKAPSFDYQGNWQDSPRKRPDVLCEVDWSQAPDDSIGWMIFDGVSTWLGESGYLIEDAPSFGFTGTHIVERPHHMNDGE